MNAEDEKLCLPAVINLIKQACKLTGKECSIFVDLQGAVIQTKDFRSGLISLPLKAGSEYRLTNNKKL
jgi:pyruvate kinase